MDLSSFLAPRHKKTGWMGIETATLIYAALTAVIMLPLWHGMDHPWRMLLDRGLIVAVMWVLREIYYRKPSRLTEFLRVVFCFALLAYWYPDTYLFCRCFPYQDHVFAFFDNGLFGLQPAVAFAQRVTNLFWSEAFHLGYFSYYPLIFLVVIYCFFLHHRRFGKYSFIIITSFLLYYLVYLFLPVAGPQYYYTFAPVDGLAAGHFPAPHHWFRLHTDMLSAGSRGGLFQWLVEQAQQGGERPTAAFPSSHVGMSTILLWLAWRMNKPLALVILPFYLLLCLATVYIKAHYFVDVVAGLFTAFFFYQISVWLYGFPLFHRKRA